MPSAAVQGATCPAAAMATTHTARLKESKMSPYLLPLTFLIVVGIAGCSFNDNDDTVTDHISIHDGSIAVHAPGRADADITAAGDLSIAGTSIPVTTPERDLLSHYYTTALTLRDHGIATGKAGVATANKALSSVASGLASGNTDKIESEVNASAAKVEAQAVLVCNDLADLRTTQETLAGQLSAFQPYALIKAQEADDCLRGMKDHHRD
jgi:hypothetical protein